MSLSREEQMSYRDCFSLFDRDGDGKISCSELGTVVRSLGQNPTDKKVSEIANNILRSQTFSYDDLCKVMTKLKSEEGFGEQEIKEAFKVFDREGEGFVNASELRHVMTNLGEKLSDEEVDEMIRSVEVDQNGSVNYDDWVAMMAVKR